VIAEQAGSEGIVFLPASSSARMGIDTHAARRRDVGKTSNLSSVAGTEGRRAEEALADCDRIEVLR